MVAVELVAVISDSGGRSGICLRTLAAVAAALGCSCGFTLPPLRTASSMWSQCLRTGGNTEIELKVEIEIGIEIEIEIQIER